MGLKGLIDILSTSPPVLLYSTLWSVLTHENAHSELQPFLN
jgi:hypothetical protein